MKPALTAFFCLTVLAACGGGAKAPEPTQQIVARGSSGPIASACATSGRRSASKTLCRCIQTAANKTLSGSDQRLGASFFGHPERAHAVRLSDTRADDAFWERWTNFGKAAAKLCRRA